MKSGRIAGALLVCALGPLAFPPALGSQPLFSTGQKADRILGPFSASASRQDFHHPARVLTAGQRLFVADTRNNRILIWNRIPSRNYVPPDVVVGQPDFISNSSGSGRTGLNWPVGVYSDGRRLFVADTNNHRILIWKKIPGANGLPADLVIGQPGFDVVSQRPADQSATVWPWDVCFDGQRLYAVCTGAGRVLVWNTLPAANNKPADLVLGQKTFFQVVRSEERWCLGTPRSIAVENGVVAVGDYDGKAVIWLRSPTVNGQSPEVVLENEVLSRKWESVKGFGQAFYGGVWPLTLKNGTLMVNGFFIYVWDRVPVADNQLYDRVLGGAYACWGPGWGLHCDGTRIYAAQTNNNRVLIYNGIPADPGAPADVVLGAPDLQTNVFLGNPGIRSFGGLFSTGKSMALCHFPGRISVYKNSPTMASQKADALIAMHKYGEYPRSGREFDPIWEPEGAWSDGESLYISDNRAGLYVYHSLPAADNQWPDYYIADKLDLESLGARTLRGLCGTDTHLFVTSEEGKLLIWNRRASLDGHRFQPPSAIINLPYALSDVASDGKRLVVSTLTQDVLVWNRIPSRSGQRPDFKLKGNPKGFNMPKGVDIRDDRLFVADTGNNRVCIYDLFPTSSRKPYDAVLGQSDLLSSSPGKSWARMLFPAAIGYDGQYLWVGEFKFGDRLLAFKARRPGGRPEPPSRLVAKASSNNQIVLSWKDNALNERGYKLEIREKPGGNFRIHGILNGNTASFPVSGLSKNTTYEFRLSAYNSSGPSKAVLVSARTLNAANAFPKELVRLRPRSQTDGELVGTRDAFFLRWGGGDPNPGDRVVYDLYFGTDPNPPLLSRGQTQALYCGGNAVKLPGSTTFYWRVVARDLNGGVTAGPVWSFTTESLADPGNPLTVGAAPGGRTDLGPGTYYFSTNEYEIAFFCAKLTARPDEGYAFAGWEGDVPEIQRRDNPLSLKFDRARLVSPRYASVSGRGRSGK